MSDNDERPVLIGFDDSEQSRAAVRQAARLFAGRSAIVATVWRTIESVAAASLVAVPAYVTSEAVDKLDESARAKALEVAERGAQLAADAGLEATAEPIAADGSVWPALVRAADERDAAVVVVGSRGRSGMKSALLGSVSSGVVHNSERPVLIVRA